MPRCAVGSMRAFSCRRFPSPAKIARIRDFGADLVVGGESYAEALAASESWRQESGALAVHAFDQAETMLGQGTLAAELEEQAPDLDTVLVAVGGGGLIAGIASWYAGRVRVVGVEPEASPTLAHALKAGQPVDAPVGGLAADSLAPRRVGAQVFPIAQALVEKMVLVSDADIAAARRPCGCGDGSRQNRAVRPPFPPFCRAAMSPGRVKRWASWSAAATRTRSISASLSLSPFWCKRSAFRGKIVGSKGFGRRAEDRGRNCGREAAPPAERANEEKLQPSG